MGAGVKAGLAAIAVRAVTMVAGCSDSGGGVSASPIDVVAACPPVLDVPSGAPDAASSAPEVAPFGAAWLCTYGLGEEWTLQAGPDRIADLLALRALVDGLEPADLMRPCTMELGPEVLLVLAGEDTLTRIVIDDYGCRWARVDGQQGLLATPEGMLAELRGLAAG